MQGEPIVVQWKQSQSGEGSVSPRSLSLLEAEDEACPRPPLCAHHATSRASGCTTSPRQVKDQEVCNFYSRALDAWAELHPRSLQKVDARGACVAQPIKYPTVSHDLGVMRLSPVLGSAPSVESA